MFCFGDFIDGLTMSCYMESNKQCGHSHPNASLQYLTSKDVDLTGLLVGGHKRRLGVWGTSGGWKSPSGVQGQSPCNGPGDEVPQKLKLFL